MSALHAKRGKGLLRVTDAKDGVYCYTSSIAHLASWSNMAGTGHIVQSLVSNGIIAAVKFGAAYYTKSGAMLAEAIHSSSDCINQVLLLFGVKRAAKGATESHPLGHGRALYFWSFLVALLLFTGGGAFSIYEGIHKINAPEPLENVAVGIAVLFVALLIEGYATFSNIKEMNQRRGAVPFARYLRETKDSDLVVVFGENAAASGGLALALLATALASTTGDTRWDGVGSLSVGVLLILVAIFLAVEVKSLLIGERADPVVEIDARRLAKESPDIESVLNIITVQQGPGEVMVAAKLRLKPSLSATQLCEAINQFEKALKSARPEVRWCFVEPDVAD